MLCFLTFFAFKSCFGQKNKRKSKANTCSPLLVPALPLGGQIGPIKFLLLSHVQLQLVPYIVTGWKPFHFPLCFCADIKRVVPPAARAALFHGILVVFPRIFVFWQPGCGGDIPSDGGG